MKLIAHRGGLESLYKANTKEALDYCLNLNYIDGVELDIRLTKDKKIVIVHDSLINFVSDGRGIVSKMTLKKLKKYNFGSKEYPSKICTLDYFLSGVLNNKIIMIEIKDKNIEIVGILEKILRKYKLNYYICSFHYEVISKVTNYKKGILIGLGQNLKYLYNKFNYNVISYYYKDNINLKKETFLWTLNSYKEGCEEFNIITDYPSRFLNLIP